MLAWGGSIHPPTVAKLPTPALPGSGFKATWNCNSSQSQPRMSPSAPVFMSRTQYIVFRRSRQELYPHLLPFVFDDYIIFLQLSRKKEKDVQYATKRRGPRYGFRQGQKRRPSFGADASCTSGRNKELTREVRLLKIHAGPVACVWIPLYF